jgi:hypothetical protein
MHPACTGVRLGEFHFWRGGEDFLEVVGERLRQAEDAGFASQPSDLYWSEAG